MSGGHILQGECWCGISHRWRHGTSQAYDLGGCRCEACRSKKAERSKRHTANRRAAGITEHGTPKGYDRYGCRCPLCKAAKKAYTDGWRSARTGATAEHGTENGYSNHGCRCDACRAAHSARTASHRAREQAETLPTAHHYGQAWTGAELEVVVTRTDLTLVQLAKMLGRTRSAVSNARSRASNDPKWIAVAGVDRG